MTCENAENKVKLSPFSQAMTLRSIAIYLVDYASLYRHLVARLNPTPTKLKPITMFQAPIPGIGKRVWVT